MRRCEICEISIEHRSKRAMICEAPSCGRDMAARKRRIYYAENCEKQKAYSREYARGRKEQRREYAQKVYQDPQKREERREYMRRYRKDHFQELKEKKADYIKANADKVKAARREALTRRKIVLQAKAAELDRILAMSPEELIQFAINRS